MSGVVSTSNIDLQTAIAADGFAFVEGRVIAAALRSEGSTADWEAFAASWDRLELDTYMADGGRYRQRRHAVYSAAPDGTIRRDPHQPHYQSLNYNPLNGGVARWFQPVEAAIGSGATLSSILSFCHSLFDHLSPDVQNWHIEVHQFRIEARADEVGRPAPEGVHRDGVDYVLVLLVSRQNIASGVTTIHTLDGQPLGTFTLTDPFDSALVNDARVAHGVTPVQPLDPGAAAHRDVLVVTFRRQL